jgi:glucose-1-phosphate thymidylyltransferase
MKGLILLGGSGTRLKPITLSINKHLLPIYDKPLFYYPLSTLMLMGIKDIGIVSDTDSLPLFKKNLGNGERFGCSFTYIAQKEPAGIPDGIKVAQNFIGTSKFTLILGDNFFYGVGLGHALTLKKFESGAKIFGCAVANPQDYGVIEIRDKKIVNIVEKPLNYISNIAITGLYQFDHQAIQIIETLKPSSSRGEFEITDLIKIYNDRNQLVFEMIPRGTAWLDTGNANSLLEASTFVRVIEQRQGFKIGCLEEIAIGNGWIDKHQLKILFDQNSNIDYYIYLNSL